jgi:glycosyltransferase involved in cell wall biosynthesis
MGRPAVVTDVPGCREVVIDGENGWLTPLGDVNALAAAMEKFILDPRLITNQGKAGRAFVENRFDARQVSLGLINTRGL